MEPEYSMAQIVTGATVTSWVCENCGHNKLPLPRRIFEIPCFTCPACGFKGDANFSISFTCLFINGLGVLPPIVDQEDHPICTTLAVLNAMGIILRVHAAFKSIIITRTLCWEDVVEKYCAVLNCEFDRDSQLDKGWGRLSGMLEVVKHKGVLDEFGDLYQIKNWCWIAEMKFHEAVLILGDGVPLITVVRYFPHLITLGENDIYSTKGYARGPEDGMHVVVLIGAAGNNGDQVFDFVDTHGDHNQVRGVGKVYAEECLGYGLIDWQP